MVPDTVTQYTCTVHYTTCIMYSCLYLVKTANDGLVIFLAALDHPSEGVGEPLLEVRVGGKDGGHEEVHQGPQLHEVVLKRRTRQQQPMLAVEGEQCLPALALEVLDVLSLQ